MRTGDTALEDATLAIERFRSACLEATWALAALALAIERFRSACLEATWALAALAFAMALCNWASSLLAAVT